MIAQALLALLADAVFDSTASAHRAMPEEMDRYLARRGLMRGDAARAAACSDTVRAGARMARRHPHAPRAASHRRPRRDDRLAAAA
jgi:hypothetical protein